MLTISVALFDAIVKHCEASAPIEACGILAGIGATGTPTRHIPMTNLLGAPDRYAFDPAEQLRVWASLDARGEDPLVFYHSHPRGPARPSPVDVDYAADPDAYYLIVSLAGGEPAAMVWRIASGLAIEAAYQIR